MHIIYHIVDHYRLEITDTEILFYSASVQAKNRPIKQYLGCHGYLQVEMYDRVLKKKRRVSLHRLVAEAVYGPCPKGLVVNHIDGDKLNNRPENLEYVTYQQNSIHARDTGLGVYPKGKDHGRYKDGRCADYNKYYRDRYKLKDRNILNEKQRIYRAKVKAGSKEED